MTDQDVEKRLAAAVRLRADMERRIDAALDVLDPGRRQLMAMAGEAYELRREVQRLMAEVYALRQGKGAEPAAPRYVVGPGPDGQTVRYEVVP